MNIVLSYQFGNKQISIEVTISGDVIFSVCDPDRDGEIGEWVTLSKEDAKQLFKTLATFLGD